MDKLVEKKDKELKDLLKQKRETLRKFRFGIAGSKIKNMKEGKQTKRDIARILTEIRKRELAGN